MVENKRCGFSSSSNSSGMIEIPGYLPKMLREWCKAAIRTQPSDLLQWSAIYFRMKGNGEHPPVKPFLDQPDLKLGPGGLTPNTLKALAKTLTNEYETYEKIEKIWKILSLDKSVLLEIIQIGKFKDHIRPMKFIGISAAYLNNRLRDTMILLCDTLSNDNSTGIPLDRFVTIYQYLARLNCTDKVPLDDSLILELNDKTENLEENTINVDAAHCFSPTGSQMSSGLDSEFSFNCVSEERDVNCWDTNSAKGIMVWQNDNINEPESLTKIINHPTIEPPITTTICDDPEFILSLKRLKENSNDDDDLLSLLSTSSIISDPYDSSIISLISSSNNIKQKDQFTSKEEFYKENINDTFTNEDYYNDGNEINTENYDTIIDNENRVAFNEDIIAEENNETSLVVKYEDNNNDTALEINGVKSHFNNIIKEANKDFIVMMALVSNENGPIPSVIDEPLADNESTNSEFSLLDKTELGANTVEQIDNSKANDQVFEEKDYINLGKESTDSETSSSSNELQYSEIDGQFSNTTLEKNSTQIKTSTSDIIFKDDSAYRKKKRKFRVNKWSSDRSSSSIQSELMDINEEGEQNDDIHDENEKYLDYSNMFTVESIKSKHDSTESLNEKEIPNIQYVLPGIGPTIPEKQIKRVIDWVTKCANNQNNCVQQHNLLHFMCPRLDYNSPKSINEHSSMC